MSARFTALFGILELMKHCFSGGSVNLIGHIFAANIFATKFRDNLFNQNVGMHFRNKVYYICLERAVGGILKHDFLQMILVNYDFYRYWVLDGEKSLLRC